MIKLIGKLSGIILTLTVFAVIGWHLYTPAINAPFIFDDIDNIVANPHIRLTTLSPSQISQIKNGPSASRPVAMLTIALNYYFHQYDPAGFRAVNVLIHIITALLVFCIATQTLNLCRVGPVFPMAFTAALIWLVHPLHTQSVTYIIQRMNSLAALFYLLALVCYIKARQIQAKGPGPAIQKTLLFFAVFTTGLLGLASKPTAATLPIMLIFYEWFFFQGLDTARLRRNLPRIFLPAFLFLIFGLLYLGTDPIDAIFNTYVNQPFTMEQRLLTEPPVLVYYLSLLLFPLPERLMLDYHFPVAQALFHPPQAALGLVTILVLVAAACLTARKNPLLSFTIIWFFVNLAIESSVVGLAIIFEHRTYLPSVFPIIAFVRLVYARLRPGPAAYVALAALACVFSIWTGQRNHIWSEKIPFWQDNNAKVPGNPRILNNLGLAYKETGKNAAAGRAFEKALYHDPEDPNPMNNLGLVFLDQGRPEEALAWFEKAISTDPGYVDAHYNRGLALMRLGRVVQATRVFEKTLDLNPFFEKAHNNLGAALLRQLFPDRAIAHFTRALELNSRFIKAHSNMGIAFYKKGMTAEALACFNRALDIDPFSIEAYNNIKRVQSQAKRYHDRITRLENMINDGVDSPKVRHLLAETYLAAGMNHLAREQLHKAIAVKPDAADSIKALGNLYGSHFRYQEAAGMYEQLSELLPGRPDIDYQLSRIYARWGKPEKSIAALNRAVKNGFTDWDRMAAEKDLENIRNSTYFKKISPRSSE